MAAAKSPAVQTTEREFVVKRVFDAPRGRVFQAWTVATRMKRWWGPRGFTAPHCKIDLRPGG